MELEGGRVAAGPGASDAHHRAPQECKRNPAPYVGHDLGIVGLVQVADLSCRALRDAYMPPGESGFGWKGRSQEKL